MRRRVPIQEYPVFNSLYCQECERRIDCLASEYCVYPEWFWYQRKKYQRKQQEKEADRRRLFITFGICIGWLLYSIYLSS